jgi:transglutaminase-like putative cysteine protease
MLLRSLIPFVTGLMVFVSGEVYAQNDQVLQDLQIFEKFGYINYSELDEPSEADAPYEYLLKEASVRFDQRSSGIVMLTDHLIRILVLSDDPIDRAEAGMIGIPFYFFDDIERITGFEARVHQPDGAFRIVGADDARIVQLNSRYSIMEVEMPDVEKETIIEYKYTLERRYIEELPDFYFSHRAPVREASLWLKNEDFLRYDVIEENISGFEFSYEEHRVDTSSIPMVFTYERPDPVFVQHWSASDIPGIEASSYISSLDDIRGKLKFQISEFGLPRQPLENSWEFVAAQIHRNVGPWQVPEAHPGLIELGDSLYHDVKPEEARMDSIFRYVNSRVQFNGDYAVFAEGDLAPVLEGQPSDQAQINMVLFTLLRGAGIEARPLYISGREFGRINKSFPSLYQFNRMLVAAGGSEKPRIMDASYEYSLPGLIPVDAYNEQGMALGKSEFEWLDITPEQSRFYLDVELNASLTEEGDLHGTIRGITDGYPAREIRRDADRGVSSEEIARETFFEVYPDAELSGSRVESGEGDRNRMIVEADFSIPHYSVTFSDGMEFRPMVVGYLFGNPFEESERRVPVTLDAPEYVSIRYSVQLPEQFESDADEGAFSTQLRGASLNEEYRADGRSLEYRFDVDISRREFSPDEYLQLRRIYERWVTLSNEVWFIRNNAVN